MLISTLKTLKKIQGYLYSSCFSFQFSVTMVLIFKGLDYFVLSSSFFVLACAFDRGFTWIKSVTRVCTFLLGFLFGNVLQLQG